MVSRIASPAGSLWDEHEDERNRLYGDALAAVAKRHGLTIPALLEATRERRSGQDRRKS